MTSRISTRVVALAALAALTACAGGEATGGTVGGEATGGTAGGGEPSAAESAGESSPSTVASTGEALPSDAEVSLSFETGGGCYDTAEPVGCGEHPFGVVTDPAHRVLLAAAAARLGALPVGENGCGDAFVDGVSETATIDVVADGDATTHVVCLSAAPGDDPAVVLLQELYDDAGR